MNHSLLNSKSLKCSSIDLTILLTCGSCLIRSVTKKMTKTMSKASNSLCLNSLLNDVPTRSSFQDTMFSNRPAPIKTREAIGI